VGNGAGSWFEVELPQLLEHFVGYDASVGQAVGSTLTGGGHIGELGLELAKAGEVLGTFKEAYMLLFMMPNLAELVAAKAVKTGVLLRACCSGCSSWPSWRTWAWCLQFRVLKLAKLANVGVVLAVHAGGLSGCLVFEVVMPPLDGYAWFGLVERIWLLVLRCGRRSCWSGWW
jgi:hypothetical protein